MGTSTSNGAANPGRTLTPITRGASTDTAAPATFLCASVPSFLTTGVAAMAMTPAELQRARQTLVSAFTTATGAATRTRSKVLVFATHTTTAATRAKAVQSSGARPKAPKSLG